MELTHTIPIVMRFLFMCLWIWFIILHLSPTHYHNPSMTTITGESPETVRFASHASLDSYGAVAINWKRSNQRRPKAQSMHRVNQQRLYRVNWPAGVIVTLLLVSGDVESNPGPVQYPCTVCKKNNNQLIHHKMSFMQITHCKVIMTFKYF